MPSDQSDASIKRRVREVGESRKLGRGAFWRIFRLRETIATQILGSLSMGLAVVALVAVIAGFLGKSLSPWNEPHEVMTEVVPKKLITSFDPVTNKEVSVSLRVLKSLIYVPSRYCIGVALVGMVLGLVGVIFSFRRREISLLCILGAALGFFVPAGSAVYEFLLDHFS